MPVDIVWEIFSLMITRIFPNPCRIQINFTYVTRKLAGRSEII